LNYTINTGKVKKETNPPGKEVRNQKITIFGFKGIGTSEANDVRGRLARPLKGSVKPKIGAWCNGSTPKYPPAGGTTGQAIALPYGNGE